jgi:hypothetical protein
MTLKTLLDTVRAIDIAQLQAAGMENNSESVNFTKRKQTSDKGRSKFQSHKHNGMTKYCLGIHTILLSVSFFYNSHPLFPLNFALLV